MIEVEARIRGKNQGIELLKIRGHANSGPYGNDLVCAGVSAIVTGGLNCLTSLDRFNIIFEPGNVVIEKKEGKSITKHDSIILWAILTQLETVEESNKEFIKIASHS